MKKRAITLLEVMIVILLIGLIGGVVSYNLKGTLDKGKAFRSKEGLKKLQDILNLEIQIAGRRSAEFAGKDKLDNVIECVKQSGLVSNPKSFVKDGWGRPYTITTNGNSVIVRSHKLEQYNTAHNIISDEEE